VSGLNQRARNYQTQKVRVSGICWNNLDWRQFQKVPSGFTPVTVDYSAFVA
jgi:hypothetical protein